MLPVFERQKGEKMRNKRRIKERANGTINAWMGAQQEKREDCSLRKKNKQVRLMETTIGMTQRQKENENN